MLGCDLFENKAATYIAWIFYVFLSAIMSMKLKNGRKDAVLSAITASLSGDICDSLILCSSSTSRLKDCQYMMK